MTGAGERIAELSFPTPDILRTRASYYRRDLVSQFASLQATEANVLLRLLDEQLPLAATKDKRVAVFASAFEHAAKWRFEMAAIGRRAPDAELEPFRTPIGRCTRYRLTPTAAEPGSPAFQLLTTLEQVALERLTMAEEVPKGYKELQNIVDLRDGRTVNGNVLIFEPRLYGPAEVKVRTAVEADREVLRHAAFETLAELEAQRRRTGPLKPGDPEIRQAFSDAAYYVFQGPWMRRGNDATVRPFLVAAYTSLFDRTPVLPQAIDLDAMVRGQDGFSEVMRQQLTMLPSHSVLENASLGHGERPTHRGGPTTRRPGGVGR
ncbi:hypothetical protein ABZX12_41025 [Kribbella sp. NPDC003505]|uniref:hypothetical protein n=1 Tax=Kribbella sp. NPDC003505 TaxID=3154448 RepID=UPI0033A35E73